MAASVFFTLLYFWILTVFLCSFNISNHAGLLGLHVSNRVISKLSADGNPETGSELFYCINVYNWLRSNKTTMPHRLRFPVSKWTKHGQTCLLISEHNTSLDLTILGFLKDCSRKDKK